MARLDYFTIIIGAVCLAAAAFLVYIGINKFRSTDPDSEANALYNDLQTYDEDDKDSYYLDQDDLTESEPSNNNNTSISNNTSTTPSNDEDLEYDFLDETPKKSPSNSSSATTSTTTTTSTNRATTRSTASYGDYMVLAGSFRDKGNAEREATRIRKLGFANTTVERFDKGTYSVILVDRFDDQSSANKLKRELAAEGVSSYVKLKR